ncbi:MAG: hypothetical protein JW822_01875 [Spirochaetales bacterium]|nr:hypothetical protein [Spirochaetales bacterium]
MTNIINYEDDIFYLTHIVKKLGDGIKLDIDPNRYKDKIYAEILFIHESSQTLFAALKKSQLKINRDLHLRNMLRFNRHYVAFLDDIINDNFTFTKYLQDYIDKLSGIKAQHTEYIEEIEDLLSEISKDSNGDQEIISEEEMRILLTNHEEEQ